MRIAIACNPGTGAACIANTLAAGLVARKHELHLISYAHPEAPDTADIPPGLHVHEVETPSYPVFRNPPWVLALAAHMAKVVRQNRIDILHLHGAIPHALAAITARSVLGPDHPLCVVTTLHGGDFSRHDDQPAFHEPISLALRRSDGLTAVSQYLATRAAKELEVCANRVAVIPSFVDRERFRPLTDEAKRVRRRRAFAANEELLVVHYSRFRPCDRTRDAITAFSRLRDEVPARLVVVGEGPESYDCRMVASARGLRDEVVWLGNETRLCELFPLADVFLLTTVIDYSGVGALEAMACGLPVVAYDAGGVPEVVANGETGYLLPVGDCDAMYRRALALATDHERRARMGAAAREATARFDAAEVAARYEAWYCEIRDRRVTPAACEWHAGATG